MSPSRFLSPDFFKSLNRDQKMVILLLIDIGLIPVSMALALLIAGTEAPQPLWQRLSDVWILMAAGALFSTLLGLPRIKLNAYEQRAILLTVAYGGLVGMTGGLVLPFYEGAFSGSVVAVFTMVLIIVAVSARFVMRELLMMIYLRGTDRTRVLVYGAGQTGVQLVSALKTDDAVEPVAFVDDNPTLQKMLVAGLPVFSPIRIEALIKERQIDRVVIAMPSLSRPKQAQISRRLVELGCDVRILPSFAALVGTGDLLERIQRVDPGTYLNRAHVEGALDGLCGIYADRAVMITGAGGSIGSELCRQVMACRPSRLILFDVSELALYQVERELSDLPGAGKTEVLPVLGSVTDEGAVRRALADGGVEIVLHAAAYKHVPMVERNQLAGLRNNALGTRVLAEAAIEAGATHFVLISTDKAVRPTNIMGASKRLAELVIQDLATRSEGTRFSMVRFGNVLGSSGSVIPLFEEQIARGGPVTLTHKEVTRYFMTIGEAARLVLLAGTYTTGGEIFVLDMGAPVPIRDLARQMIEAAGYTVRDRDAPDGDIEITVTGLRPGEKLHEELVIGSDLRGTGHPKILRAHEAYLSQIEVATALRDISRAIESNDEEAARLTLRRWVDGYVSAAAPSAADLLNAPS